jgi:iron complex outermembrane receptor protein
VIVTGSRIKGTEEAALPVQVIGREEIERSGVTSSEQLLQSVSAALQGNNNVVAASGSGVTSGGVSGVSLRGLGSQRTLVLINGRRVAGGGTPTDSTTVDVNNIPLSAIDHVEVLKDGASALYGSDAIAGVVNFILSENYEGASATGYFGGTNDGGSISRANGSVGFGSMQSDGYNVLLFANYQKENAIFGRDRRFARSAIDEKNLNDTTSGNSFPANVTAADGSTDSFNPNAANCAPSVSSSFFGDGVCRFDPSRLVSLVPDTERMSLYGSARFRLGESLELYTEASYAQSTTDYLIQPVPLSDQFQLPVNNPLFGVAPYNGFSTIILSPTSQFYPTAAVQAQTGGATPDLLVRYRSLATGNRDLTDTSRQPRGVVGLRGDVAGWDFDTNIVYSETRLSERNNGGYPLMTKLLPLLNSGQVNFFGPNTPDIQAQIDATQFRGDAYRTKTSLGSVAGNISRSLFELPAGKVGIALGAELRREKFSLDPSAEIQIGDISGYGGNFLPTDKSRDVTAAYGELNIPIIRSLEAGVALRYDDYDLVGSKTVPKFSLKYKPIDAVTLRSSFGKGFRAPSLVELFQPQTTGVSGQGISDPARCAINAQDTTSCNTQFPLLVGGNADLKPEESRNLTFGVVYQPMPSLSLSADVFRIKLTDTIIFGIDPQQILNDPQFASLITRAPADPSAPGVPGRVTQIDQTNLNLGETRIRGVDFGARWTVAVGALGNLSVDYSGTYSDQYEIQGLDGSFLSINDRVSPITNGAGGVIPRYHHNLSLGWARGDWNASITQNYQQGYEDVAGTFEDATDPAFSPRDVASYITHDIQATYAGLSNMSIALGVRNAFDRDPPYTNAGGQSYFQAGYDPGYADPRGRFFYGTATYSFK